MSETSILVLVGSLRAGSTNRQLAEAAAQVAPAGVALTIYDGLADIPFYNEDVDVEGTVPSAATEFRAAIAGSDAILVITPEYNGTIPAVLKNAIDWASRPYGSSALSGKPLAAIGSAFGQFGGGWAHGGAQSSAMARNARFVRADVLVIIAGINDYRHHVPFATTTLRLASWTNALSSIARK